MKKLIIVLGILVAVNVLVAQEIEQEQEKSKIQEFKTRLNLTDTQADQLMDLREKYMPEMKSLRSDESKTRSEKMRAAADIIEQRESEMKKILSESQLKELSILKKERRAHMRDRREKMKERMRKRWR